MQELRDIKGIVEISDNSLLFLFGISVFTVLLSVGILLYFKFRKKRVKRRFLKTKKELAKERLENIDYDDPKSVTYTFIEDAGEFIDEKSKPEFLKIVEELKPYKYKKEVPQIDEELKKRVKDFIREIKWQI